MNGDIPNMTDREILIQQGTVLDKLCGNITSLKKDNCKEHEKIFVKVDSIIVTKISNKLFFWLTGIIITIEILLASAIGVINIKTTDNASDVEHIEHKINRLHP